MIFFGEPPLSGSFSFVSARERYVLSFDLVMSYLTSSKGDLAVVYSKSDLIGFSKSGTIATVGSSGAASMAFKSFNFGSLSSVLC